MDERILCVAWFEGYSEAVSEERLVIKPTKIFRHRDNCSVDFFSNQLRTTYNANAR